MALTLGRAFAGDVRLLLVGAAAVPAVAVEPDDVAAQQVEIHTAIYIADVLDIFFVI